MAALVLGLILLLGSHSLRVVSPAARGALVTAIGEGPYRAAFSLVTILGLVLIVWGFGLAWQEPEFLYTPPGWGRHVAMALMIPALILAFASAFPPGRIARSFGHPLLTATMLWGVSHLLANGDLAGVVLFSAILVWAVLDRVLQPALPAKPAAEVSLRWDFAAIAAGIALYVILVAGLHYRMFGVSPTG